MSGKSCKICKSSESINVTFFNAPKEAHRRDAWSNSCGVSITENSVVCQKHFSDRDFYGKKITKLKVDAVPLPLDNKTKWQLESVLAIKTEPPEFVHVDDSITCTDYTLEQSSLNIKEELIEPFAFINEECFDDNSDNPIRTQDDGNSEVSAGSNGKRTSESTCGRIVVEADRSGSQCYRIQCIYCPTVFRAANNENGENDFWQNFIKHLNTNHQSKIIQSPVKKDTNVVIQQKISTTATTPTTNSKSPAKDVKNFVESSPSSSKPIFSIDKLTSDQIKDPDPESDRGESDEDIREAQSCEEDSDYENNDSCDDESYEPKSKRAKREKSLKRATNIKPNEVKRCDKIISFDYTEKKYVIGFLELLKSHAILWHPRQSIMKRSNEALGNLADEFSKKFPNYTISKEQLRQSINRVKDLYHRISDENHRRRLKTSMFKLRYPEYFQLCDEIEEESKNIVKNCNNCHMKFYNEIDLQIHKVKRHRIGELPFKCERCDYAFACPEKLASHEAKHNRSKTFKCEICNHGFFDENKLQAHMVLHTDDCKQVCEICGKKFPSLSKYRRHKLHHEAPKEKCVVCGKLYFEKWTLSEHMKSHRNERQYKCDICGKTFNRQEGVTIHKRGVHKIKTQTKKYVWVNRVTCATASNSEGGGGALQNENLKTGETHNSNSNSSSLSSTTNETNIPDIKPTILNNPNYHSNIISFDVLNSLLN